MRLYHMSYKFGFTQTKFIIFQLLPFETPSNQGLRKGKGLVGAIFYGGDIEYFLVTRR